MYKGLARSLLRGGIVFINYLDRWAVFSEALRDHWSHDPLWLVDLGMHLCTSTYFSQASKSANCLFDDGDADDYDDLPPSSTTTLPLPPKLRPPLPPKQKINKSSEVVRAHKFATFPRLCFIYICLSDNSTRKILTSEAKWLSMLFFQYLAITTN